MTTSSRPTWDYGAPALHITSTASERNPAMADSPVYVIIYPGGTIEWGGPDLTAAEKAMGNYGTGKAFLDPTQRFRIMTSDVALVLTDQFAPNPHARRALAYLTRTHESHGHELRGPVALYPWNPRNEWDGSRPMTHDEQERITLALLHAECRPA